jgi:hypothetical protein
MDVATRTTLANLAGSFLVLLAFVLLAIGAVVTFMLWRGIGTARPEVRRLMLLLEEQAAKAEVITKDTSRAVIEPQVAIVSRLVAVRTTVAALIGRDGGSHDRPSS